MGVSILFLMILCHIIDDFVLQPVCLSKLKQKNWWEKEGKYAGIYKNDYLMALAIHALSWAIMIHLPLFILFIIPGWILVLSILINASIHFYIDDLKANKYKINLITDQSIHFIQIILTFILYSILI